MQSPPSPPWMVLTGSVTSAWPLLALPTLPRKGEWVRRDEHLCCVPSSLLFSCSSAGRGRGVAALGSERGPSQGWDSVGSRASIWVQAVLSSAI